MNDPVLKILHLSYPLPQAYLGSCQTYVVKFSFVKQFSQESFIIGIWQVPNTPQQII